MGFYDKLLGLLFALFVTNKFGISSSTVVNTAHRAISQNPHYSEIIQRLKTGDENFLDLGCSGWEN
jgi:hypothetical protein